MQQVVRDFETAEEESEGLRLVRRSFAYDYRYDQPPLDVIPRFTATGDIPTTLSVSRPDGIELELFAGQFTAGERESVRVSVDRDSENAVFAFLKEHEGEEITSMIDVKQLDPTTIIFAEAGTRHAREPEAPARPVRVHPHDDAAVATTGRPTIPISSSRARSRACSAPTTPSATCGPASWPG